MLTAIFILLLVVFFPGLILFGGGIAIIFGIIYGLIVTIGVFIYVYDTVKKKRELKRFQKSETGEAIRERLAEIKEPGQTVSLGGFTWKAVAVEDETALLICMEGGKIPSYKIRGVQNDKMDREGIDSVRYMENILMDRMSEESKEILMDTPETWVFKYKRYSKKSVYGTRYFFLLNKNEVEQYFHGVENMASFLGEKARPCFVRVEKYDKSLEKSFVFRFLLFKCVDTDFSSDMRFYPAMRVKLPK